MSDVVEFTDEEGTRLRVSDEGGFFYVWTEHGESNEAPIMSIEAGDLVHLAHRLMVVAFAAMEAEAASP